MTNLCPAQKDVLRIQTACRGIDSCILVKKQNNSHSYSGKAHFRAPKTQTITHSKRAQSCRQTALSQHWCLISSQICIPGLNKYHLSFFLDCISSSLSLSQTCLATSVLCLCGHPKPLHSVLSRW